VGDPLNGGFVVAKRSLVPDLVDDYVREVITRETPLQGRLRAETAALPRGRMQIGPDQGALLALLVRLGGVRRALEVGTFTGYSALAVASALPEDGRLITCDVSAEWTAVARRYWAEAGVSGRIELRLGPAAQTLAELLRDGAGTFDFAFIDADKPSYDTYYEACLGLVRPGGLIAVDNVLWSGTVADPSATDDEETEAIRALNLKVRDDDRVDFCLLTVGDGVLLARKRPPR
jgi:predicted O-methyltransferase YrrM